MIYNNIERVLVITKWILNYYNTGFSLEITPKVQKVSQKYAFIPPNATFRRHLYFVAQPKQIAVQKHAALKTWSWARDKKSVRTDYDYEGNLQEAHKHNKGCAVMYSLR